MKAVHRDAPVSTGPSPIVKPDTAVDTRYYEAHPPNSLAERAMIFARDAIYRDFLRLMTPSDTDRILDVGVSDVVNDAANLLERLYPYSHNITAVGLGEGGAFRSAYPVVDFRRIAAGAPLPFADGAFDIVASNAVIEHVGSRLAQKAFVAELARVGRRVFLTAPNRWFPVEHHTGAPLAHYHPATFRAACRLMGKSAWLDPAELLLTDLGDLRACAPLGRLFRTGYTGLAMGPFSSNIYLAIDGFEPSV